ncbi:autotransporter assembly complex protein TamA [Croceicoccus gelatinilyticus]|uniref:autotransporter assembly complex protein TamA n=1 Tax=Croceicoccus gelatinilyticus TaxID=2835536 RepID=UPI001BD03A1D|nr:BamA/TamA family outer membrane protein [Croceicoccus gelatinilyticus]MBS7669178.1 BamA/TamA family outer membrane protein [Croceicoccus gelatinilyticus]
MALVLSSLSIQPAFAQSADAELEDLIPDAAVADPEAWAMETEAAQTPEDSGPDPDTPLDGEGEFTLAWPDDDFDVAIEPLEEDPELAEALSRRAPRPAADIALPEMAGEESEEEAERVSNEISKRITLRYPASFAEFENIEEFEQRFRDLSDIRLLADKDDNLAQLANRAKADTELLRTLLSVYGYYDGDVTQRVQTPREGEGSGENGTIRASDATFIFNIDPGPRYKFGAIDLGELANVGADYELLRSAFEIETGDYVNEDTIVFERIDLDVALGENGYAFAEVGAPELTVDHARDEGDLALPVTPGGKYVFGSVVSTLPKFLSGKHLGEISRFDAGDLYKESDVEDLRRAILATGLVSTLSIEPREVQAPANGEPGVVELDVDMTEGPLRTIAGSLGYASTDGFRAEASWEHRNFFPPEGMLRVRAIAGTQEQLLGATVRRNNWHGRDKVISLDVFANTIDRDAYEARTVSAIAKYERLSTLIFQKELSYSIGLELVATQEREGTLDGQVGPRETYFVAAAPARVLWDESDDLLDPTNGFRLEAWASPEISRNNGTQSFYGRSYLEGRYYQPVSDSIVLAARAKVGTIQGTALDNIAPSRRLYAGGGGSVRGYGYQDIGPKDDLGDPTGGRSLTELSMEARVRTGFMDGALSVVPFVDAGAVDTTTTPRLRDLQFGAGIGIRYHTNFGPLRVDLATPINRRPGDSRIAVYVALGQAF